MSNIHELAFSAEEIDELLDSVDKKTIYQDATQSEHGLMSTTDKTKLDALPTAQQIDGALNAKVDKEAGKGLSQNDYTDADKAKVASALQSETDPTVPSWAKQPNKPSYNYSEIGNTPDLSGFITKSVNDLTNYYLKSETYTKAEVEALVGAIQQFHYEIYQTLPSSGESNVLYIIGPAGSGSDRYEEYVYANNDWNKIGDTSIDLSGYVTTSALNTALADYTTTASLTELLSGKQDTISDLSAIRSGASAGTTAYQKPQSGIPQTDLASSVQTSLGNADTAYQKPSTGIPESDLSPNVQSQLNKHFKGWYESLDELKAAHTAVEGDSAYVKDASPATTWSIYVYDSTASSNNYWADSGTNADTSNVQTFASGEEVNETSIDNTHLVNPKNGALPTAEDTMQLKAKLEGVTASEEKASYTIVDGYYINYDGSLKGYSSGHCTVIPINGAKKVRFLGNEIVSQSGNNYSYAFWNNPTYVDSSTVVFSSYYDVKIGETSLPKEYVVNVPDGATYIAITVPTGNVPNFYCYLQSGDTVMEEIGNIDGQLNGVKGYVNLGFDLFVGYFNTYTSGKIKNSFTSVSSYKCFRTPCSPGDKFKIFGKGGDSVGILYTFSNDTDVEGYYTVIKNGYANMDTRVGGLEVVAPEGSKYLSINFYQYDATKDKVQVWKFTEQGFVEKTDNAINGYDGFVEQDVDWHINHYWNGSNNPVGNSLGNTTGTKCYRFADMAGKKMRLYGAGGTSYVPLYIFADASTNKISKYYSADYNYHNAPLEVTVPDNAYYVYVNLYNYTETDRVEVYGHIDGLVEKTAKPLNGKTLVVFGDSLSEFTNPKVDGKGWIDHAKDICGANIINVAIGGTQLKQRYSKLPTLFDSTKAYSVGDWVFYKPSTTMNCYECTTQHTGAWDGNDFSEVTYNSTLYAQLDIVSIISAICNTSIETYADRLVDTIACAQCIADHNYGDDNTLIVQQLSEIDWSAVDAVVIMAGGNDFSASAFGSVDSSDKMVESGAINEIVRLMSSTYKNIPIYYSTDTVKWFNYSGGQGSDSDWCDVYVPSGGSLTYREFFAAIVNQFKLHHIPTIDLINELGWNKWNFSNFFMDYDGTHPYKGFRQIAEKIVCSILANKVF